MNINPETIGKIIGNILGNILLSYWFLFTLNTLLDKNYPYDLSYLISSYFIVNFITSIKRKS